MALDVTERRNLSDARKIETERYSALAQICRGLLWTSIGDGHLPAAEASETHGSPVNWINLLHEDAREAVLREWAVSVETAQPFSVECRLQRADGLYRWHEGGGAAQDR
ncbi:PAS domain-containing protein [Bradyrhizobium sp. 62B]|uniref:PAS domain-containing protein n=1 Tax=Bradyrhizobium sp. 62B TaxID=2898442 RepID=UPI0035DC1C49